MGKIRDAVDRFFRNYVSPVFMLLLFVSFVLWYIIKLSYTYTTEIPVPVNIDGHKFRVACRVEGLGSHLFAYRFYRSDKTKLTLDKIDHTFIDGDTLRIALSPSSLLDAIAISHPDIRFISIGEVPEIDLGPREEAVE